MRRRIGNAREVNNLYILEEPKALGSLSEV